MRWTYCVHSRTQVRSGILRLPAAETTCHELNHMNTIMEGRMPSIERWSRRGDKALLREHPGSDEATREGYSYRHSSPSRGHGDEPSKQAGSKRAATCVVGLLEHVTVNGRYEGRHVSTIASKVHFRWRTLEHVPHTPDPERWNAQLHICGWAGPAFICPIAFNSNEDISEPRLVHQINKSRVGGKGHHFP